MREPSVPQHLAHVNAVFGVDAIWVIIVWGSCSNHPLLEPVWGINALNQSQHFTRKDPVGLLRFGACAKVLFKVLTGGVHAYLTAEHAGPNDGRDHPERAARRPRPNKLVGGSNQGPCTRSLGIEAGVTPFNSIHENRDLPVPIPFGLRKIRWPTPGETESPALDVPQASRHATRTFGADRKSSHGGQRQFSDCGVG